MNYLKITSGYVVQKFNDVGECLSQEFVSNDCCEYETETGDAINSQQMPFGGQEYFMFSMVQPEMVTCSGKSCSN